MLFLKCAAYSPPGTSSWQVWITPRPASSPRMASWWVGSNPRVAPSNSGSASCWVCSIGRKPPSHSGSASCLSWSSLRAASSPQTAHRWGIVLALMSTTWPLVSLDHHLVVGRCHLLQEHLELVDQIIICVQHLLEIQDHILLYVFVEAGPVTTLLLFTASEVKLQVHPL